MRSGLILAGGASTRFGEPKALVPFRGRPLVRWVADALRATCDELLLSVGGFHHEEALADAVPEARVVRDLVPSRGPIEGFARGASAARGRILLVAPCDAPLLHPALYGCLLGELRDHEAAVPRVEALDPVRAVYRLEAVRRVLAAEGRVPSPSALVDRLDAAIVGPVVLREVDPGLVSFLDVNARVDLDQVLRAAGALA